MRWLDRVIEATNMNLNQVQESVEDRRAWRALVHGVTKSQLSKAHLTSLSRMSGSRSATTLSGLSGISKSFWYSSSVYSCQPDDQLRTASVEGNRSNVAVFASRTGTTRTSYR